MFGVAINEEKIVIALCIEKMAEKLHALRTSGCKILSSSITVEIKSLQNLF